MFKITNRKGFHMTFANGYTVSVQFGYGNYCENHFNGEAYDASYNNSGNDVVSKNAEVGVWGSENEWVTKKFFPNAGDDVVGYLSADEVADLLARVALA